MMFFLLQLILSRGIFLLHGNSSDTRSSLFIIPGLIVITLLYIIGSVIRKGYRSLKFRKQCERHQLTPEEINFLTTVAKTLYISDPLKIVSSAENYTHFTAQVAHHLARLEMSDETFLQEVANFDLIGKKLGIEPRLPSLTSSHTLKEGQKLSIIWTDSSRTTTISFDTTIVKIHDLFFAIDPPDIESQHIINPEKNPILEVAVEDYGKKPCFFEALLAHTIPASLQLWYLTYSHDIITDTAAGPLDLPATMEYPEDPEGAKNCNLNVTLQDIDTSSCTVTVPSQHLPLIDGMVVTLSFKLEDSSMKCQGTLQHQRDDQYIIDFQKLPDQDFKVIKEFCAHRKKRSREIRKHAFARKKL
ncbi:MAG: hypothetical protein ACQEP8_05710 [Chlamydiota bacterium]